LLDENVKRSLLIAPTEKAPHIVIRAIGDSNAPPLRTLDPEILQWCEANNFSLLTNNRASMPVHLQAHLAAGRDVPGIFILSRNMDINSTVDHLALIVGASEAEEYIDHIHFLPSTSL
jgi:hypothetical protein